MPGDVVSGGLDRQGARTDDRQAGGTDIAEVGELLGHMVEAERVAELGECRFSGPIVKGAGR